MIITAATGLIIGCTTSISSIKAEQFATNKLSKKLFILIAAFGEKAEGSYFLIAD